MELTLICYLLEENGSFIKDGTYSSSELQRTESLQTNKMLKIWMVLQALFQF